MRRLAAAVIPLATLAVLTGCASSEETPSEDQRSFGEALDSGAPCGELFDIRNELDPKDPAIETINESLRSIGCFNSSSERTDQ